MTIFSQRHFVAITAVIKASKSKEGLVNGLIGLFEVDNPKFDREKFRKAIK